MGWLSIIGSIFGFVSGPLTEIGKKIVDLKIQQSNAITEEQRIRVNEEIRTLEIQREVLLRQNDRDAHITTFVRVGLLFPAACLLWKLLLWDIVVGSFVGCSGHTEGRPECTWYTTDNPQQNLWWFVYVVVGFYFVQSISTVWKR